MTALATRVANDATDSTQDNMSPAVTEPQQLHETPEEHEEQGPRGVRGVLLMLVLGGLTAFGSLSLDMYLPALPNIARDLMSTAAQVQLTLTACLLGLGLGQLLSGPASDAWGRRRPMLIGLTVYVVASLACTVAPTAAVLVGLRLIQGLAGAAGIVIARAVIRDLYSGAAAARSFSSLMLVAGIAPICAPLIGGALLQVTGWRGVFATLSVLGVLLLVTVTLGLRETLPPHRRTTAGLGSTLRALRLLATDRAFVGPALAVGLAFGALFAYLSGSPFVIQNIYGASPQVYSLFFGFNALGLMAVTRLNARLVGRVDPRRLLTIGLSITTLAGLGLLFVTMTHTFGLAGILAMLFVLVGSFGLVTPNATAVALSQSSQTAGSASAILGTLQFMIGAVTAPLVGVAGRATALPMALLIAVLAGLAMLAFSSLTRGTAASPAAASPAAASPAAA